MLIHDFFLQALLDALLLEESGIVTKEDMDGQVVYMLNLQEQLTKRVRHGLVPQTTRPSQEDLNVVGDFLKSPCVDYIYNENQDFSGNFCFLSIWADGARVFPTQRGGFQKTLWAVLHFFFKSEN